MPPKAKPAAKAKGGKEGDEIENNRKAIKKFLKTYEKACQDKNLVPLPSVMQKLTRLSKSEDGPSTLNIPYFITEECDVDGMQALLESLDSTLPGYEKISFWKNNMDDKTIQLIGKVSLRRFVIQLGSGFNLIQSLKNWS